MTDLRVVLLFSQETACIDAFTGKAAVSNSLTSMNFWLISSFKATCYVRLVAFKRLKAYSKIRLVFELDASWP